MPPEALEKSPRYSTTIDMFSFGHLSLYTIIQEFPVPISSTFMDSDNPGMVVGRTEIQRRESCIQLMSQQLGSRHPLAQLVMQCLHNDPRQRPSARQVLHQLEQLRAQIADPYERMSKLEMIHALREKEIRIQELEAAAGGGGGGGRRGGGDLQAQVVELQVCHSRHIMHCKLFAS